MFDILRHKENENQNNTKIPSHPSQIGHHQENKQQQMLARYGKKELYALLTGM
jgi:hypothetical protein